MADKVDWSADPTLRDRLIAEKARGEIVRTALIWTPPFVLLAVGAIFFFIDRLTGPNYGATWFLVTLLTIFAVLTGYLSISAWRDLRNGSTELEGYVTRRWARRDSLVLQTRYIRVESQILRIDLRLYEDLREGDFVRVEFYPRSQVVCRLEKLPDPADEEQDEDVSLAFDAKRLP